MVVQVEELAALAEARVAAPITSTFGPTSGKMAGSLREQMKYANPDYTGCWYGNLENPAMPMQKYESRCGTFPIKPITSGILEMEPD